MLIGIGTFVFVIDPYQQYRARSVYIGDQRLEIGGIAKNHDYDAFFTGSSMTMNHYPEVADSLWGWKTKNFSIMGATDDDYTIMLPFILKCGKAKNVIIGIDFFSFARRRGAVSAYLYDSNIFNDYEYLWNYTSLKNSIGYLLNPRPEKNLYHFNSPVGKEHLIKDYVSKYLLGYEEEDFDLDEMTRRYDESLLEIIKNNSDSIRWYIYFPPYSIAEFVIYDKFGSLDANMKLKSHIIQTLTFVRNVELYDFQCAPWITDLNQYMDLRHHSHDYNKAIFKAIHDGQYKIQGPYHENELKRLVKEYADSLLKYIN